MPVLGGDLQQPDPLQPGAATSAQQTSQQDLAQREVDNTPPLGPQESTLSRSVVIAVDQVVPVQASSLPLPTGAATEQSLRNLILPQAAGVSNAAGPMMQILAQDMDATYIASTINPALMTTAGRLKVDTEAGERVSDATISLRMSDVQSRRILESMVLEMIEQSMRNIADVRGGSDRYGFEMR